MTAPPVRELLARCAATRQRVTDNHMFTVTREGDRVGTFRLQLFTALSIRPVAIATWTLGDGAPPTSHAEKYAAEVWRRHFPDCTEPPIWIQVQHLPDLPDYSPRFTLVTFDEERPYVLTGPHWFPMSDADAARLVGATVDRGRGQRKELPRPQAHKSYPIYQVAWVGLLPRPKDMDRGCITSTAPTWQCLCLQLVPRRRVRDCCYYHSVDWHRVSGAAIRIMRHTRRAGPAGEAFTDRLRELVHAETLPFEEKQALKELLDDGTGIQIDRDDDGNRHCINGRHRVSAMLGVGVRRTVIIRWERPDSNTGP